MASQSACSANARACSREMPRSTICCTSVPSCVAAAIPGGDVADVGRVWLDMQGVYRYSMVKV